MLFGYWGGVAFANTESLIAGSANVETKTTAGLSKIREEKLGALRLCFNRLES